MLLLLANQYLLDTSQFFLQINIVLSVPHLLLKFCQLNVFYNSFVNRHESLCTLQKLLSMFDLVLKGSFKLLLQISLFIFFWFCFKMSKIYWLDVIVKHCDVDGVRSCLSVVRALIASEGRAFVDWKRRWQGLLQLFLVWFANFDNWLSYLLVCLESWFIRAHFWQRLNFQF